MEKALGAADRDASPSAWVAENTRWIICINKRPLQEPHVNSAQQPVTKCLQSSYGWLQEAWPCGGKEIIAMVFPQNLTDLSLHRKFILLGGLGYFPLVSLIQHGGLPH